MSGEHPCATPGCDKQVEASRLMCVGHWKALPAWIQREVNATWKRVHRDRPAYEDARGQAVKFWADKAEERAARDAVKAEKANIQGKLL